jgi:hypothetical protein
MHLFYCVKNEHKFPRFLTFLQNFKFPNILYTVIRASLRVYVCVP